VQTDSAMTVIGSSTGIAATWTMMFAVHTTMMKQTNQLAAEALAAAAAALLHSDDAHANMPRESLKKNVGRSDPTTR
jgi:hypothetical protein